MKKLLVGLMGAVLMFGSAVVLAGVPAGKEELKLTHLDGKKKEAVVFGHAKHDTEFKKKGGAAIECKDCHHAAKAEADIKACSSCHPAAGSEPKDKAPAMADAKFGTKSVIFHATCKDGCHKEMKAEGKKLTSCKVCHTKK